MHLTYQRKGWSVGLVMSLLVVILLVIAACTGAPAATPAAETPAAAEAEATAEAMEEATEEPDEEATAEATEEATKEATEEATEEATKEPAEEGDMTPTPVAEEEAMLSPEAEAGQYLVTISRGCGCHFNRDLGGYAGGAFAFEPGGISVYPANLTPHEETGIGDWTPEEFATALRTGATPDGAQLHPIMPYRAFSHLSDEDALNIAEAVIGG